MAGDNLADAEKQKPRKLTKVYSVSHLLDFTNPPTLRKKMLQGLRLKQVKWSNQADLTIKVCWLTVMAPYISKTVMMNEKNAMPSATELSAKKMIQ